MLIDSNASDSEISLLREVHRDLDITVDQLIESVRQRSPYDLATALRILDSSLTADNKTRFLELVEIRRISHSGHSRFWDYQILQPSRR